MSFDKNQDSYESLKPVKDRFPRIVLIIILTEFCERFSFSGMRAFLTLYLRSKLGYTDDEATECYHIFSTCVYVFPIIGGILADNYLGKFRTILYLLFVYAAGNILVSVTAIPPLGLPGRLCTLIGLLLITIGTGGIKPCVSAFGGDQFIQPHQEKYLAVYFSLLYFFLCTGSLIAKTVSPILRSEIHCFGDKDCYSVAFGAPGVIIIVSMVVFVCAKSRFVIKKPEGNIVLDFIKCISLGIKNAVSGKKTEKHAHWLDSTQHEYDAKFIKDIKKTLSILTLFTVLPVFWALLDQMGSRWTLQASKMDGRFGFITIKPDQMQVLAPINILILIPITQKMEQAKDESTVNQKPVSDNLPKLEYIYPALNRRNILTNPLHKLTLGGVMAGVAFIASGAIEIYLRTTYPQLPSSGYCQLRIFNGYNCPITITNENLNITHTMLPLSHFVNKNIEVNRTTSVPIRFQGKCINDTIKTFILEENKAISFYITQNQILRYQDNVEKSKAGFPVIRFLISNEIKSNITLFNTKSQYVDETLAPGLSPLLETFTSTYKVMVDGHDVLQEAILENGGVYTVMIGKNKYGNLKAKLIVITEPNSITMAWLLPQFVIISAAEVLFAVTGNEFAFKEAPSSMKAVMTSVWLLTEAMGNVIIIIVTRVFSSYRLETQSFIYVGLMFVSITVFHFLSGGYEFRQDGDIPLKVMTKEVNKRSKDIDRRSTDVDRRSTDVDRRPKDEERRSKDIDRRSYYSVEQSDF